MSEKLAVILVRGVIRANRAIIDTLHMLKLRRKNQCVLVNKNPEMSGMVEKVKDYVTWGDIDAEMADAVKNIMKEGVARMQPPRKGFGRKGIKVHFNAGGALGYRGEKINDLIRRMM